MIFTSDLTIDELLLLEEVGFEPLELCLGSSYFHIGWSSDMFWSASQELTDVSRMMVNARRIAMSRLLDQASAFGADGVVGMRIEIERERHHAEFVAMGTAVRRRAGDGQAWRTAYDRPFACDLSGVDFWALVRAGYRPVTLAHGVCVYHVGRSSLGGWLMGSLNQEHPEFTQALYDARELAMTRMQAESWGAGAHAGIVGIDLREDSHGWASHVMEVVAVGTGVARIDDAAHETHEPAKAVLFAHDRPQGEVQL